MTNAPGNPNINNTPDNQGISPVVDIIVDSSTQISDTMKSNNLPARIQDVTAIQIENVFKSYFSNITQDANGNSIDMWDDRLGETITKNLQSLKDADIIYDSTIPFDINHPLFKLLICKSHTLDNVLRISHMLDIRTDWHM